MIAARYARQSGHSAIPAQNEIDIILASDRWLAVKPITRAIVTLRAVDYYKSHVPLKQQILHDLTCVLEVLELWVLPHGALQWKSHVPYDQHNDPPYDADASQAASKTAHASSLRGLRWIEVVKHASYTTNNAQVTLSILIYLGELGAPCSTHEQSMNDFTSVRATSCDPYH